MQTHPFGAQNGSDVRLSIDKTAVPRQEDCAITRSGAVSPKGERYDPDTLALTAATVMPYEGVPPDAITALQTTNAAMDLEKTSIIHPSDKVPPSGQEDTAGALGERSLANRPSFQRIEAGSTTPVQQISCPSNSGAPHAGSIRDSAEGATTNAPPPDLHPKPNLQPRMPQEPSHTVGRPAIAGSTIGVPGIEEPIESQFDIELDPALFFDKFSNMLPQPQLYEFCLLTGRERDFQAQLWRVQADGSFHASEWAPTRGPPLKPYNRDVLLIEDVDIRC